MTTSELKSYIDRILGNNIRLLLPSYWWKRAFGAVIDKVDEKVEKSDLKTINGESVLGEGDLRVGVKSVESVEALENMDAQVGDIASVGVENAQEVHVAECFMKEPSINSVFGVPAEDWQKMTPVNYIDVFVSNQTAESDTLIFYLITEGGYPNDVIQVAVYPTSTDRFTSCYYHFNSDSFDNTVLLAQNSKVHESNVKSLNNLLLEKEYRLCFATNKEMGTLSKDEVACLESHLKLYDKESSADAYIKSDSWEKLAKEYVVSSEEELNRLDAPVGSIARIAYDGNKKINLFECKVPSKQDNEESIIKNWDEYTRIAKIESAVPVGSDTSVLFLIKFFNPREDEPVAAISFDKGTCIVTLISSNNGEQKARNVSLEEFNKILLQKDYRLYNIDYATEAAVVDLITNHMTFYGLPTVSNAYIKGETWTRLLKEGDAVRAVHISYDDTPLTDEQKAENAKTYRIAKENGNVILTLEGAPIMWYAEESGDISAMVQESVGISKVLLYFYLHADGNITIELYDDIPEYVDVSNKEGRMKFLSLIQLYGYLPRMLFAGAVVIAYEIKNEEVGFCVESQVGLIKYVFSTEDYSLIRLEQVENEYTQRISELEKKVAALEAKLS